MHFRAPAPRQPRLRTRCARAALGLAVLAGAAAAARGQSYDLTVNKIEISQGIQGGSTPQVAGRPTFVRATPRLFGTPPGPIFADALMRVSIAGVEIAGSPFYSDNGPIQIKALPDQSQEHDTLNFVFVPPLVANMTVEVEINPPGPNHVAESNGANNKKSNTNVPFTCRGVVEIAFSPIDYRPSGGSTPNPPNPALIEPGVGDNFVQGIYPGPDLDYHRTDAPTKLWTQSVASSGSSLLTALEVDLQLMNPKPDFLYAWVPGGLSYNGQSVINGKVSMGNTDPVRHQRTFAHELGHNTGLQHNSITVNLVGVDVEHHLALPLGLPQIKISSLKDIMYAGLLTQEAWIWESNYVHFYNHAAWACGTDKAAVGSGSALMLTGTLDRASGAVAITQALAIPGAEPTPAVTPAEADLVVRAFAGGRLAAELYVRAAMGADACCSAESAADSSTHVDPIAGFSAVLQPLAPGAPAIDAVVVADVAGRSSAALARSPAAPAIAFTGVEPAGGGPGAVRVSWSGTDADGDGIRYYLRYSPAPGRWIPLLTDTQATSHEVDLAALPAATASAAFELIASDGLNSTRVQSDFGLGALGVKLGASNAPWAYMISPDSGATAWRGANVLFHGNGFDLEDRRLDGASVTWTSSLDGPLGSGRVLTVADLSVGTHVITFEARDSANLVATDTVTITVVDRGLPSTGAPVCQQDLGFGGPGTADLSLCGGDLSTGTTATLELSGAPASAAVFLFAGSVNAPTPLLGGTLVPLPALVIANGIANGSGTLSLPNVPGGGGPLTIYVQALYADGSQAQGYGFSNAVKATFLP